MPNSVTGRRRYLSMNEQYGIDATAAGIGSLWGAAINRPRLLPRVRKQHDSSDEKS